jgi:hypothetical protein
MHIRVEAHETLFRGRELPLAELWRDQLVPSHRAMNGSGPSSPAATQKLALAHDKLFI